MVVDANKSPKRGLQPEDMLPPPRVLIVDDNPIHASAVKRALRNPAFTFGRLKCEIDAVEDVSTARHYLRQDSIDIYFLDLEISEKANEGLLAPSVGRAFVRDVVQATNAGVIVCSSLSEETEAADLLEIGADDYVEKTSSPDVIAARALSVWRRTLQSRPPDAERSRLAHAGRTFRFGDWRIVVGNRLVTHLDGQAIKLSPTEHSFLRYLCAVPSHDIDSETFNIEVLDRDPHKVHVRLDNFVHRLRKKFGGRLELAAQGGGIYKLFDVQELLASFK
jgi:DNA-binding response OmpR family regulator